MTQPNAADQLRKARDRLYEAIKPHLEAYEAETGLIVEEINIDRPVQLTGVRERPMRGIRVRTNATNLT